MEKEEIERIRIDLKHFEKIVKSELSFHYSEGIKLFKMCRSLLSALEASQRDVEGLREALLILYNETKDYITINHLGDPHQNQSMRLARNALARTEKEGGGKKTGSVVHRQIHSCDIPGCVSCGNPPDEE